MSGKYYAVKYCGDFGLIKPFGGLRESSIFTMVAPTPSIIMGIENKIFGDNENRIIKHRLNFSTIQETSETTESIDKKGSTWFIPKNVLINPELFLLVSKKEHVDIMENSSIRLCRNEDILIPTDVIELDNIDDFDDEVNFPGYELIPCSEEHPMGNWYGFNNYSNDNQYCYLNIIGKPVSML